MAVTTTVRWLNEKHFVGIDSGNHSVVLSGQADGIGVKPSEMLLIALASCDTVHVQAGAGIVADSDPTSEHIESQNKAKAVAEAIRYPENGLM